ncbi:dTDP-4-dehydrorhamnose reductase [Cellulomonas sp. KH9]|uniref:dTDP-4-dehydrorhamnose reductase n=1 Tax=Cellulomonas sp. KH9 TaxID=1855324 RepID=UPI000B7E2243|nr:dTDP-4-dehydrorhamnose reductase [Cellulomonas sp. KH9]
MRWMVTGAEGMLGADLVATLGDAGEEVTPTSRATLDVTDADAVLDAVAGHDVVVNCAAWTAVDAAEDDEPAAWWVNALGPANLARAASRVGARIVQVSTDYVVSGEAPDPLPADAAPHPLQAYGRTKLSGEWAVRAEAPASHLVLRTAWLYGAHGACFPRTIVRVARERGSLDVVDDQWGQPTWTRDVAALALAAVRQDVAPGTYHATSSGRTSWWGFARAAVAAAGMDPDVVRPSTSATLDRRAVRPAWSVLDHGSLRAVGVEPIGDWEQRWAVAADEVLAGV